MAATRHETGTGNEIRELTWEETIEYFDTQVRKRLGISGEEFLQRRDAGEYDEIADDVFGHPGLMYLIMLSQSVRPFS